MAILLVLKHLNCWSKKEWLVNDSKNGVEPVFSKRQNSKYSQLSSIKSIIFKELKQV